MSTEKPDSHISDYEQRRREAAASRRRGIAKLLPESKPEPIDDTPEEPVPEEPPKKKRVFLVILLSLLGLLLAALLGVFLLFHHFYSSMNIQAREAPEAVYDPAEIAILLEGELEEPVEGAPVLTDDEVVALDKELKEGVAANELFEDKDVYSILLMGNDSRSNNISERTDAMILVSINSSTKEIYLTSFLRDLYLYIPGYGSQRLNAANVFGGPGHTVDTIEQNFGISVNNYAAVSFSAFENIIDTLGGVYIYLSGAEADLLGLGSSGGTYYLNGHNALRYCRIRSLDSDFGRTERQRTVLETLWNDLRYSISLTKAYELMDVILPQVTTDLTQADCLNLLAIAMEVLEYDIVSQSIPASGTYEITMVKGMSVIVADMEENSAHLRTTVFGE